jgi:hypothetical protein
MTTAQYALKVIEQVVYSDIKSAVKYLEKDYVIKATLHGKKNMRKPKFSIMLTCGVPNYRERSFIKDCIKAGEPFPIKKIQIRGEGK